jgi:hypothetical protein
VVAKILSGGGGALPARRAEYAFVPTGDWANACSERAEIYEAVRKAGPRVAGGPINYRVRHRAKLWSKGEKPILSQQVVEGNADPSI